MAAVREPILHTVAIKELRPTQIAVGMREVAAKRKAWQAESDDKGAEFPGQHMVPVILGPKSRCYVADHHHLALALHEEGVASVLVTDLVDDPFRSLAGELRFAGGYAKDTTPFQRVPMGGLHAPADRYGAVAC